MYLSLKKKILSVGEINSLTAGTQKAQEKRKKKKNPTLQQKKNWEQRWANYKLTSM